MVRVAQRGHGANASIRTPLWRFLGPPGLWLLSVTKAPVEQVLRVPLHALGASPSSRPAMAPRSGPA